MRTLIRGKKERGFTLIEVMIAMAIMIIGLLAFWKMHITSISADAMSNQMTKAVFFANQKIEELRASDFASLASGTDTVTDVITYKRNWYVSTYSALDDVKELRVIVGWLGEGCATNIDNCLHKIEMATLIYNSE